MRRALIVTLNVALAVGLLLSPFRVRSQSFTDLPNRALEVWLLGENFNGTTAAMDATNEYSGAVGHMFLEGGAGTKTCSTSGCHIYFEVIPSTTWADVGTNLRVGIQDVDATGFPDGTFDVFADLVPGTETIASTNQYRFAMESGSKSVSHGAFVAIMATMTARGGTDSVNLDGYQSTPGVYYDGGVPYGVRNTGAAAKNVVATKFIIQFDDGTYGWIAQRPMGQIDASGTVSQITFGNGSTPDEYAVVGTLPFDCGLREMTWSIDDNITTDTFDYVLYEDPLGSPTVPTNGTITVDPDLTGQVAGSVPVTGRFATSHHLVSGTAYGFAIKPTSAGTITINYSSIQNDANIIAAAKRPKIFSSFSSYSRSDGTGAFGTEVSTRVFWMGIRCDRLVE